MNGPFRTAEDYELFLYTLHNQFPSIRRSTVTFVRRGTSLARVAGELHFDQNVRLVVRERLVFDRLPIMMDWYGYEIWLGEEKLYWYDSQPHAGDLILERTYPNHKHIPPGIKHNRIPAPEMSFVQPNLPVLIREIEDLIRQIESTSGSA